MLAEYPKIFVAHDVAILKWDIPYHLPCVSLLMWQIKIGIFHFISHIPKKNMLLDVAIFFWDIPVYPIFFHTPVHRCGGKKMGYGISHIPSNRCGTGA